LSGVVARIEEDTTLVTFELSEDAKTTVGALIATRLAA
jgi:hypothetical protein